MKFKTYDRVKRYIKRHGCYWLASCAEGNNVSYPSSAWEPPTGLRARLDFARMFNWAKDQGFNK